MSDVNRKLETIFEAAIEIDSPTERIDFLAKSCGENSELRQEVEVLLKSHEEAGSFLDDGCSEFDLTLLSTDDVSADDFSADLTINQEEIGQSVLMKMEDVLDDVPHVALRDAENDEQAPLLKPSSSEIPKLRTDGRYRVDGEIARGGMGAVLRGRDTDLGRELAIKVLLDSHKDKPDVIQRFVEEAQIGGQLQHPGIAPLYELGQFKDKRPFFAMKLVKGETLASLLAKRKKTEDNRTELLGVFEHICQTMAYVHSRGVIHRDLKPANIMVGAFGEVQVMDWGLAKVLTSGGVADEKKAHDRQQERSLIQTARSSDSEAPEQFGSHTQVGSVMGTPAYMPPEQAKGQIDLLDERADVFGLGAILCEILTGAPPYVGKSGRKVFFKASRGDLDDALSRIEAEELDPELQQLACRCLAVDLEVRLQDAGEVVEALSDYLNNVQERLRQAELDMANAEARAEEFQRRRKLHFAIVAILLVGLTAAGFAASHFRTLEHSQRTLAGEKTELANRNLKLADEREAQRMAAVDAQKVAVDAQKTAEAEQNKTAAAQALAESNLNDARKNLYAAQMAHVSHSLGNPGAISRLDKTIKSWIPQPGESDLRGWEWYYLSSHSQLDTIKIRPRPHSYALIALAWSPDGSKLITVGKDGYPALMHDTITGDRIARIPRGSEVHGGSVADAEFSPDGKQFVLFGSSTANQRSRMGLYDAETCELIREIKGLAAVGPVCFSPDGSQLGINSGPNLLIVDASTGETAQEQSYGNLSAGKIFTAEDTRLIHRTICWGPEGLRLAAIRAQAVFIYEPAVARAVKILPFYSQPEHLSFGQSGKLLAVSFSAKPNDKTADDTVSSDATKRVEVWNISTKPNLIFQCEVPVKFNDAGVGFTLHPDGDFVAVSSGTEATVFTLKDGQEVSRHPFDEHTLLMSWSPDGRRLASAGLLDHTDIWDPFRKGADLELGAHDGFAWSRDGQRLVAWKDDKATVWDTRDWKILRVIETSSVIRDACVDSGNRRLITALGDATVVQWMIDSGIQHGDSVSVDCVSVDAHPKQHLIVCGKTNVIKVVNLDSGEEIARTMVGAVWAEFAQNCRWHPHGNRVVIHSSSSGATAWLDFKNNGLIRTGQGNVGMSSNGQYMLTVPFTKRGISVNHHRTNGRIDSLGRLDVGAEWGLDVTNDGSRILLPRSDGLSMLHRETETAVLTWPGQSGRAVWDSWNLRVASIVDGRLTVRDTTAGYAHERSSLLLPWLESLVVQNSTELDSRKIKSRYSLPSLIATAAANNSWPLVFELISILEPDESEIPLVVEAVLDATEFGIGSETSLKVGENVQSETVERFLRHLESSLPADSAVRQRVDQTAKSIKAAARANALLKDLTNWSVLEPVELSSVNGTQLTRQSDGSIIASGINPERSRYAIVGIPNVSRVASMRLEAVPDSRLPYGSSGRADNGSFTVSGVSVGVRSKSDGHVRDVPVQGVWTDIDRGGPVEASTDGDEGTHWSLGGSSTECHAAVYSLVEPEAVDAALELVVTIDSGTSYKHHGLGRFRLSVSDVPASLPREQKLVAAKQVGDAWGKLAIALHLAGETAELEELLVEHPKAAAYSGDMHGIDSNWNQAIRDYSRAIGTRTRLLDLLPKRGDAYVATGQWKLAKHDWGDATTLQPGLMTTAFNRFVQAERWDEAGYFGLQLSAEKSPTLMLRVAAVLALSRNQNAYRDFCRKCVQAFSAKPESQRVTYICKACLASPEGLSVDQLPWQQLTKMTNESLAKQSQQSSWNLGLRALLEFRKGEFETSVRFAELAQRHRPVEASEAFNLSVLAMALHRLGRIEEAERVLKQAEMTTEKVVSRDKSGGHDTLIARVLLQEAKVAIRADGVPVSQDVRAIDKD